MTERSGDHHTCTIGRTLVADPARVFGALADPEAKRWWFAPPPEWATSDHELDFRVGGREYLTVASPDGKVHTFDGRYDDVVPDRRVVFASQLHVGATLRSVSVTTIELSPNGAGTALTFTEQVVVLDGGDRATSREEGSRALLDNLAAEVGGDGPAT
jgi:uncharacterized protein YndB with AHSA1/START domain